MDKTTTMIMQQLISYGVYHTHTNDNLRIMKALNDLRDNRIIEMEYKHIGGVHSVMVTLRNKVVLNNHR